MIILIILALSSHDCLSYNHDYNDYQPAWAFWLVFYYGNGALAFHTMLDDIRSLDGHHHFHNCNFLMLVMRMMVRKMVRKYLLCVQGFTCCNFMDIILFMAMMLLRAMVPGAT